HPLSCYVSHFNLTRQQDASEAFVHLLTSLRDEFSHCYVPYKSSLADITMFHSKVYKQREGNQPECKRWKQNIFGPFDGTIGSTLSCRNCSSVLSLDFENFHCLPLSPVADINGDIINGCSLVDCLKHFTVLEHLDNYRCDHCWHNAASKYFSLQSEVDEVKFCDHIFYEVVLVSQFNLTVPHIDICTRKKLTNCAPVSTMIVAIASIYLVQRKQHGQYLRKPQSSWLSLVVRRSCAFICYVLLLVLMVNL
uniref:ubiquitinyl hydrolase 1 n=1 Tax=Aegilops tauschii subsp. strangulata TaxID=200361 RepID=A0A453BZA5_AEGTS